MVAFMYRFRADSPLLPALFIGAFVVLTACGGPVDPSSLRGKPLASLDAGQVRGLCAHNLGAYRKAIPRTDWYTQYCAGSALSVAALSAQTATPTKQRCLELLVECNPTPAIEDKSPEEECERVDPAEAKACNAPVELLQACLDERTAATTSVVAKVRSGELCDAKEPLRALDLLGGPSCQQLKAKCPDFRLALPGFTRGVK